MFKKVIGFLKQPVVIIVIIVVLYLSTHVSEHLDPTAPTIITLPPAPVAPEAPVIQLVDPSVQTADIPSGSAPVPMSQVTKHKGKKTMTCYSE